MKSGDVLYEIWADEETGKLEWSEHVVRSIRKGVVYATLKASWTWGKVSKKHGDYGWLDPISSEWRTSWKLGDAPAGRLATTRLTAIKNAIAYRKRWPSDDDVLNASIIKRLETMLTKERNSKGKKS